jgi:uncharacterized integral membrane protein
MNPKLSLFSVAIIIDVLIFLLALVASADLRDSTIFWRWVCATLLVIPAGAYVLGRLLNTGR